MRQPLSELVRTAAAEMPKTPERRRGNAFADPPPTSLPRALFWQFASGVARPGEFQSALIDALPGRTREAFEELPPREKVERVLAWKRQAEALQGQVSEQELERFFAEELDPEMRAELLRLPASDMQQALRRLYRRQPGRAFAGGGGWGQPPWREESGRPEGPRGPERGGRPPRPGGPSGEGPPGEGPPGDWRRGPGEFGRSGAPSDRGPGFGPPRRERPFDGPPHGRDDPRRRGEGGGPPREGDDRPPRRD
jgi:hypothetical protein